MILMAVAIFAAGCQEGDVYYSEAYYDTVSSTYTLIPRQEDWLLTETDNEMFFDVEFTMPEITPAVCDNGTITAYMIEGANQLAIPDVRHFDDAPAPYTRTVSYYFRPGKIYFTLAYSDFAYDPMQTIPFTFRIVITEPR
jgi:hypothetical protein